MCEQQRKPHKHAALIKAWADGAKIQIATQIYPGVAAAWHDVGRNGNPIFWSESSMFRIKPEPKPDVTAYTTIKSSKSYESLCWFAEQLPNNNVKAVFGGETGELKSISKI